MAGRISFTCHQHLNMTERFGKQEKQMLVGLTPGVEQQQGKNFKQF